MTRGYGLALHSGRWHVLALRGAESTAEGAWVSLGGSGSFAPAFRVWLACITAEASL